MLCLPRRHQSRQLAGAPTANQLLGDGDGDGDDSDGDDGYDGGFDMDNDNDGVFETVPTVPSTFGEGLRLNFGYVCQSFFSVPCVRSPFCLPTRLCPVTPRRCILTFGRVSSADKTSYNIQQFVA